MPFLNVRPGDHRRGIAGQSGESHGVMARLVHINGSHQGNVVELRGRRTALIDDCGAAAGNAAAGPADLPVSA